MPVSFSSVSKGKIRTGSYEPRPQLPVKNPAHKNLRRHGSRLCIHGKFNEQIDTHPLKKPPFFFFCGKLRLGFSREENGRRRIKGKYCGCKPVLLRLDNLGQKFSVPLVDSVKFPDCHRRMLFPLKFCRSCYNLHSFNPRLVSFLL